MRPTSLGAEAIRRRKPVWAALSELWLDTELDENQLRGIAQVLIDSGFDSAKLRQIYLYEVAPVVYRNLLIPAGNWSGFDEDWLYKTIVESLATRGKFAWLLIRLRRKPMTSATEESWRLVMDILQSKKNCNRQ